jgi:hypothetical protein
MLVPTSAQASAPSCSRGRARPLGGAAAGDPAPARAFIRLDHQCLPTRDRCRGDHRHDPCAARADDARQRRARALRPGPAEQAGGSAARRNRPPAALTQPLLEIAAASPSSPAAVGVLKLSSQAETGGSRSKEQCPPSDPVVVRVLLVRGSRCATHRPVGLVCRATWRPVLLAPRLPPPRSCLCRSQASREPHGASASRPKGDVVGVDRGARLHEDAVVSVTSTAWTAVPIPAIATLREALAVGAGAFLETVSAARELCTSSDS